MDADLIALRDEIDAHLAEVEHTRGTCAGHPALARANPILAAFYRRLRHAGKPAKVALVAVMRKLTFCSTASLETLTCPQLAC